MVLYAFLAILLAIVTPIIFTVKTYCFKRLDAIYPAWEWNRDGGFFENIFYVVAVIVYASDPRVTLYWDDWVIGIFCGLIVYTAKQIFAQSVLNGYAGPAGSLQSCSSIVTALLNFFFFGEAVMPLEILGFLVGLFGAAVITSGDFVLDRLRKRRSLV